MDKFKFSIALVSILSLNDFLVADQFILDDKGEPPSYLPTPVPGKSLVEAEARTNERDYYMYLAGGSDIKLVNDGSSFTLRSRRFHKDTTDWSTYRYNNANLVFSYTTKGDQASKISLHLTNKNAYDFQLGSETTISGPVIGKNSNLFIKAESSSFSTPIGKWLRVGFGEKYVENEGAFIGVGDSKSSFNLDSNSDIIFGDIADSNGLKHKVYLNQGAGLNLKSAKHIVFKNIMSSSYITFLKEYYDKGLEHTVGCGADISVYREGCNRIFSIGDNSKVSLDGDKVTNEGYLFAKGNKGIVNITSKTEFINKVNEKIKNNLKLNDGILKLEENSGLEAYGVITAQNNGQVNIKAPSVINETDGAFLNLGGTFKVDGDFVNKGWLIAGQGSPTSAFSHFDVTGKTKFETGSKIALALYREKPIIGDQNILFLRSAKGIEGFDNIKSTDIRLLRIDKKQDISDKLTKDVVNKTFSYNSNLNGENIFKVELSNKNKELYYRLALTKEALDKSIDDIIADQKDKEKKKLFSEKLKKENPDAIKILNAVKATSKKFGPTVVLEYDKAFQGQEKPYKELVKNINQVSNDMKTFNLAVDNMAVVKALHFNTQTNIASRMAKSNEPFANTMPMERNTLPEPRAYETNTDQSLAMNSSKGKKSLIVLPDMESNLANRAKNNKKDEKVVLNSHTKKEDFSSVDMPSSFWFNALSSNADLKNSDLSLFGFSFGFDKRYKNHISGVYVTGANSKTNFDGNIAESKAKNIQIGAYGRVFIENIELDLNGFYNLGSNKIKRNTEFYGEKIAHETEGDIHTIGIGSSIGYVFDIENGYYIKPLIGVNAYFSKTPSYKESGDLAFSKDGGTNTAVSMTLATEFRKHFYNGNYLYIVPGIEQDLSRGQKNVVKFSGHDTVFSPKMDDKKQTYVTIYGGTELKMSETFLFNLNLGTKMSRDEKYYNVNAGFKLKF